MRGNFILPQIAALLGVDPDPMSEVYSTGFASGKKKKRNAAFFIIIN